MSPKEVTRIEITDEVFKEPLEVINKLSEHLETLKYTKVIQTFVLEDSKLNLVLSKQGSDYFKGRIVWIGNKKDDSEGTIICVDTGSEIKQINPSAENTEAAILDKKRDTIRISTASKSKCVVCGKDIEIFDDVAGCPICQAKAHRQHLLEWINEHHSCPVCKKSLNVNPNGIIFID
ncbi:MAG: hypothetical protein EU539_01385 [Promethearchaeota archaeon]|nr:MAG: hypothetical protein EU539_01385 [Candidatus Lokiarchaeota archaeon]